MIEDYETMLCEGKTKPSTRYTEDTLLSAMEKAGAKETDPDAERKGIGTPATRADIIEKLVTDRYVCREKKNLLATDLGKKLTTAQIESLLSAKKTMIKGFKSKKNGGKEYDAYLTLTGTEPCTYTGKDGAEKSGFRPVYDMTFPKKKKAKGKAG